VSPAEEYQERKAAERAERDRIRAIVSASVDAMDARKAEAAKHPPPRERKLSKAERAKNKPGRFWARSSAGVMLNQRYTIGWRGINPCW
jgi:hypothetical protein